MNFEDRITISSEQLLISVDNTLDKLDTFRYDSQYKSLLGENFVNKLTQWENTIRKRKNDPFTLTVIGDFKRGKSTFINALLKEEVATTDVTAETVTMNRISYGAPGNEAVLDANKRLRLSNDELKRERLEQVLKQVDKPITVLELKRPNEFLKNVTIIDTPGMNDALQNFEEMAKDAIMQADAVVYLYNVLYPLSLTEQMFLRAAVVPQKYTTLYIVGNFADTLESKENYDKMRGMLDERVHGLFPNGELYIISALNEVIRTTNSEQEHQDSELTDILEEQFDELRKSMEKNVEDKKEHVISDRVLRLTVAMIENLSAELDMIETGLSMNESDAALMLKKVNNEKDAGIEKQISLTKEIESLVESMREETTGWMLEFLERIVNEVPNLRTQSSENLRKYYEFYCIDLLQEAMQRCVEYHQEMLYDKIESVSTTLVTDLVSAFDSNKKYSFGINLDNKMWTKGDTIGFAASMVYGMGTFGTVASIAGNLASGFIRAPEVESRTGELIEQISSKLSCLSDSVTKTIKDVYKQMSEKAEVLIADYYADELAEIERAVAQSVDVAQKEENKKEEIRSAVKKARAILDECLESVQ